jgi:Ca2+-binding RTX toxin-like protein
LAAVIDAINAATPDSSGLAVEIVLTVADGDYSGQTVDLSPGVVLIIDGTGNSVTFEGASPAFTVSSGNVVVRGVTFVNATDAPTILVTGGSLVLHDSVVQETSGGSQAAIEITGGSVDLGTDQVPGGNTFDVSGAGELVRNLSTSLVHAVGNEFQVDGTTITDSAEIEDYIYHGLDAVGLGIVDVGSATLFVGPGGSLQSAIDGASPDTTIHVAAGVTEFYDAGAKLVTIVFENGPTVSQHADEVSLGLRTLTITGTPANDTISFTSGPGAGVVSAAIGGVPTGKFMPTGRLIAYGEDGNDQITVDEAIALTAILDGGEGDDELTAGAGDDLLLGGGGNDWLTGAAGNDFLAGGQEADRIVGGAGHDVLVASELTSHLTHNDLLLIAQQWAANRTEDSSTSDDVLDEVFGGFDSLTGSSGADWFIVTLNDKITDFKKNNKDGDVLTLV